METINPDSVATRPRVSFGFAYAAHPVVLMFAFLGGLCVEAVVSKADYNTRLDALAPVTCVITFVVDLCVNRRWRNRAACYLWVLALVWFSFGVISTYGEWNPAWDHKTHARYVTDNLFGKTLDCSGSECMGELLFTMPLTASLAYSLGALIGLRSSPRRRPFASRS